MDAFSHVHRFERVRVRVGGQSVNVQYPGSRWSTVRPRVYGAASYIIQFIMLHEPFAVDEPLKRRYCNLLPPAAGDVAASLPLQESIASIAAGANMKASIPPRSAKT